MAESPKMGQTPTTEFATLVIDGAEASLCISREEKYNALNEQLISELINLLEWTAERSVGSTGELVDGEGNAIFNLSEILTADTNNKEGSTVDYGPMIENLESEIQSMNNLNNSNNE